MRHAPSLLLGGLAVFASCGSDDAPNSSSFCAEYCRAYVVCDDAVVAPLFCASDARENCVSACERATNGLGDSQSAALKCADCVISYGDANVCDRRKADQTGRVSCSRTCSSADEGARDKFYSDFDELLTGISDQKTSCDNTGEIPFSAADPQVRRNGGELNATGSLVCTGSCCRGSSSSIWASTPYRSVPAGNYEAGIRGITRTPEESELSFDVRWKGSDRITESIRASATPSDGAVRFTLSTTVEDLEIRLICPIDADAVTSFDSFYLTRL